MGRRRNPQDDTRNRGNQQRQQPPQNAPRDRDTAPSLETDDGPDFSAEQILHVNRFVQERLSRQKRQLDLAQTSAINRAKKQWETEQQEARKKEEQTENERLKEELKETKKEAEKSGQDRVRAANERLIRSEARRIAGELGIPEEKYDRFLKTVGDISDIELSDDPEDESFLDEIESRMQGTINDIPEFVSTPEPEEEEGEEEEEPSEEQRRESDLAHRVDGSKAGRKTNLGSASNPARKGGPVKTEIDYRDASEEEVADALAQHGIRSRRVSGMAGVGGRRNRRGQG